MMHVAAEQKTSLADLTALCDDELCERIDDRSLSREDRRRAEEELDRREAARTRELEERYARQQTVPQEVIDALLIGRARGELPPAEGPRLRSKVAQWWVSVLLEGEEEASVPQSEKLRRDKLENAARHTFLEEKRQARIQAGPGPEPSRGTQAWRDWLDAKEAAPEPEPSPEQDGDDAPDAPQSEEPSARRQTATTDEWEGSLFKSMVEPDRSKRCWVLMSKGSTRPEPTITADGERLPMRGEKLVLVECEWRAGAWRKTGRTKTGTLLQLFKQADWVGKLPKMGRVRHALTVENHRLIAPYWTAGASRREAAKETGCSRRTVKAVYDILDAEAAR